MSEFPLIRSYRPSDWAAVWSIIRPVFRAGETYAIPTDIAEADAHRLWIEAPAAAYVAQDDGGRVLATYYIKANHPGPGSHVCNCGYIVDRSARGQGLASALCGHSQTVAVELGFRAMQYNLVVATNQGALRVWRRHGFEIVGTLPGAFQHPELGDVDAHLLYKSLMSGTGS
ncbi:ribosomal protein S18 acetylase RimI-like enzyme [Tamilnaduibacter salinus]|uniref:Ribosomal protein S18 acetylase RimI-like enzyme n=1 Tax=Tamilnaduibacter salinus TaxID=1484056 RepID=A0A2U1D064_9GAMM|nr:GNAT family N-acetyltransferase [Tamilnaduibacter salinus]PVY78417.1 ribosomal protein S18 acetylase RimI-like enzyme [Tamilnaduibacter salinus]